MLRGVTGSGKTEIYLRLAEQVCRGGRRVLLMVPEIALTPAMAALFRGLFGERVAIQHSALSDGERHDQWQRIRRGEVDVVVGTRSAVFAPLDNVGLIIVDEEHDGSYKQEETPRYHGRDVAVVRGSRERALVVLGSATPSMETAQNAATGKYGRVVARASRARSAAGQRPHRQHARRVRGGTVPTSSSAAAGARRSRSAWRVRSRSSCCSIDAAMRRPCSAVSAATRSIVRTAACR